MLLGVTERLEFVDAPSHVEDLKRYRDRSYAMRGNRIAIFTDHEADLVEVHPPSRGSVELGGLTIEHCSLVTAMRQSAYVGWSFRILSPDPSLPAALGKMAGRHLGVPPPPAYAGTNLIVLIFMFPKSMHATRN